MTLADTVRSANDALQKDAAAAASTKAFGAATTAWISDKDPPAPPPPPPPGGLDFSKFVRKGGAPGWVINTVSGVVGGKQSDWHLEIDRWGQAGCKILRMDLVQDLTAQNRFDAMMTYAKNTYGIEVCAELRGTSHQAGSPSLAAQFAAAMAERFGTRILKYGYVNEPNLPYGGGTQTRRYPDAAVYGRELAAVYAAIKGVKNDLIVSTGGMGYDSPGSFSKWWPTAYANGAQDHFDLLDIHLYNMPGGANWVEGLALERQSKKVFVSEAGSNAGAPTQGATIKAALTVQNPDILTVCIYNMHNETSTYAMWGAFTATTPKDAYNVFKLVP